MAIGKPRVSVCLDVAARLVLYEDFLIGLNPHSLRAQDGAACRGSGSHRCELLWREIYKNSHFLCYNNLIIGW